MPRKPRIYYTETDKALMWVRWRKGDSLETIARLFDRSHGSVARILRRTGGIRQPKKMRSGRTLLVELTQHFGLGVAYHSCQRQTANPGSTPPLGTT